MKVYIVSLATGLLAGLIYGLLNVRSPAPPVIALVGLLGILAGEQIPPLVTRILRGERMAISAVREQCGEHMFGALPGGSSGDPHGPATAGAGRA